MTTLRGPEEPLTSLESTLMEVEQVPRVRSIGRRFERRAKVVSLLSVVVVLLYGAWLSYNSVRLAETAAQTTINEQDIKDLRQANQIRLARGLPQIPLPEPGQPVDVKALAAAAAALALDDIQYDPRFKGSTGPPGPSGQPCSPSTPGCTGPSGQDGQTGSQGQQGPIGETGPQGAPGKDGLPGADGVSITNVQLMNNPCRFVFEFSSGQSVSIEVSPVVCV